MDAGYSLEEKKEYVLMRYQKSYDLATAYFMAEVTPDQIKILDKDEGFQFRVQYLKAEMNERIFSSIIDCLDNEDPKLKRMAAMDLGKILDKDRFLGKPEDKVNTNVPDTINLVGVKPKKSS